MACHLADLQVWWLQRCTRSFARHGPKSVARHCRSHHELIMGPRSWGWCRAMSSFYAPSPIPINNYWVVWGEVWTSIDVSMWRFLVFHHWFVVLPRLLRLAALLLPSFGLAVSASSGSAGNQLRTLTECDWDLPQDATTLISQCFALSIFNWTIQFAVCFSKCYVFPSQWCPFPRIASKPEHLGYFWKLQRLSFPSPGFRRILQFACTLASLPVLTSGNRPTKSAKVPKLCSWFLTLTLFLIKVSFSLQILPRLFLWEKLFNLAKPLPVQSDTTIRLRVFEIVQLGLPQSRKL